MENVLVPIDGSDPALDALSFAFDRFPEADVHVLHVVQVDEFPDDPNIRPIEYAEKRASEFISDARSRAEEHGCEITTAIEHGHPGKTIISYTEQHDIDHIVIGSRGRTGSSRVLLGSVAELVARRSPVPVTIAR